MKVLIISHNPITTYQSMGKTMLSLFSAFDRSELCQLYIYPTLPDIDVCDSYFRITDRDVLKSLKKFGKVTPRIIKEDDIDTSQHSIYENEKESDFYKKNKKNSATLLCRDIVWKLSRWYNSTLKRWLDEENPTCIFLAPGESKFIYNIALKIARKRNIDIFTYVCDDYYFVNSPSGIINRVQLKMLKSKMKCTMKKSEGIITICDELARDYHEEFGTETKVIFTGTNYSIAEKPIELSTAKGITYLGNLTCNRFVTIAEIGRTLDSINEKEKTEYRLFLYSPPLKDDIKKIFSEIKSIQYCGYVTGDEFQKILHTPGVLLHTEAFDAQSVDRVKHSVSTKIADSLGSGNLLFAYGPSEVASIGHLIRNDCAVVVSKTDNLEDELRKVLFEGKCEDIVRRAIETANKYHCSSKNSLMLKTFLK